MNSKRELLLKAIEEMLNGNIDKEYPICKNLYVKTNGLISSEIMVKKFSPTWKHFSGDKTYPVSGEDVWCEYLEDRGMWWTGEQLELRMSLLEHLKSELLKRTDEEVEELLS